MNARLPGHTRPGLVPALALTSLLFAFGFGVAPAHAARGTVGPPILGVEWFTVPEAPCDSQDVRLMLTACECQVDLQYAGLDPTNGIVHTLLYVRPDIACVTCVPDTFEVNLGRLPAGVHERTVRFGIEYETTPSLSWPPSPAFGNVVFHVSPTCGSPTGIAYLDHVVIGHPRRCPEPCPPLVCPDDSIDVYLAGTFPHDCVWLRGVDLVPVPTAGPLPAPPLVQVRYEESSCLGRPCREGPIPWAARVRLPGLPARGNVPYALPVAGFLRDTCIPTDTIGRPVGTNSFAFTVAESCSTQPPPTADCVRVEWRGAVRLEDAPARRGCTATYAPGQDVSLLFMIHSPRPVAGLQGRFRLEPRAGLVVREIVAVQPGWQVARVAGAEGEVSFVAFAGPGAPPIPASTTGAALPALQLRLEPTAVALPEVVHLAALDIFASDPAGLGMRACPEIATTVYPPASVAVLCRAPSACDANRDGRTDVRDLVTMVYCLAPPENVRLMCPDLNVLDCDGNGAFELGDVFCCARRMLGGTGGEPPPDSLRRDAPRITVGFGLPRSLEGGLLEVPVRFEGMAGVAAARVDVAYPDARYEVVDVAFATAPPSWWTLHEVGAGRIGLAVLDLGGLGGTEPIPANAPESGVALLRLRLRPGATAGGEIALAAHDFATADGMALDTPNAEARLDLAALGRVALSPARPNPFGATTSFTLTLPEEGAVDAAVFDALGRRVATLMRETRAAAGVYTLRWDGAADDGTRAAGGVYFVRIAAAHGATAKKVLFLPGTAR